MSLILHAAFFILCCILKYPQTFCKLLLGAIRLPVDSVSKLYHCICSIMAANHGPNGATNDTSANLASLTPAQPVEHHTPPIKCNWCLDPVPATELFVSGCRNPSFHLICYPCIRQAFNIAAEDESMSAPHCCGTVLDINRDWVRLILGTELVAKYLKAGKADKDEHHTHCSACSAVIPYALITTGKFARCPSCNTASCTWCKQLAHEGQECSLSDDERATTALAQAQGWQRCFRCGRWIERSQGCSHIT